MGAARYCEECGKPLAPGVKFCEECGAPVPAGEPLAKTDETVPDRGPLAVIPFAYQQRGMFSTDRCSLVVYPDQVIIAFIPPDRRKEEDEAGAAVMAALAEKHLEGKSFWQLAAATGSALFRLSWNPVGFNTETSLKDRKLLGTVKLTKRPWERYLSMTPEAVMAEDRRNVMILRDTIGYIRGESDPETNTDQILIYSSAGMTRLFFDHGTYFLARPVLFSFLCPDTGSVEHGIGVIPSGGEPQVKGFGFQYTWTLVVTDRRVIFFMDTDDFVDEINPFVEEKQREAKKAGRKLREGDLAGNPDAPWQRLAGEPVQSLIDESDVNFFIRLDVIRSVNVLDDDTVRFDIPGGPYSIVFADGSSDHIRSVLGRVLGSRLS